MLLIVVGTDIFILLSYREHVDGTCTQERIPAFCKAFIMRGSRLVLVGEQQVAGSIPGPKRSLTPPCVTEGEQVKSCSGGLLLS